MNPWKSWRFNSISPFNCQSPFSKHQRCHQDLPWRWGLSAKRKVNYNWGLAYTLRSTVLKGHPNMEFLGLVELALVPGIAVGHQLSPSNDRKIHGFSLEYGRGLWFHDSIYFPTQENKYHQKPGCNEVRRHFFWLQTSWATHGKRLKRLKVVGSVEASLGARNAHNGPVWGYWAFNSGFRKAKVEPLFFWEKIGNSTFDDCVVSQRQSGVPFVSIPRKSPGTHDS